MSKDMSMFKKMKERIADEVNSATSKLQNMQIIDQLSSSISQQIAPETPNQLLPDHGDLFDVPQSSKQFSLINTTNKGEFCEEDELNSEISPQHQLFNECSIRRLHESSNLLRLTIDNKQSDTNFSNMTNVMSDNLGPVINFKEISSDIEDDFETDSTKDGLDVEIDLLSDALISADSPDQKDKSAQPILDQNTARDKLRARYKNIVHAIRKLSEEYYNHKNRFEVTEKDLTDQIEVLKKELESAKNDSSNQDSLLSNLTSSSNERSISKSPQLTSKTSVKFRDLERLLAKCKESLRLKNAQLQSLRESLGDVEQFKDSINELRQELGELKEAHETWTISIAENKRTMHQEIEIKSRDLDKMKAENNELHSRVNNGQIKIKQLKAALQDLESRLVSTSAAHQKERESLTKELTKAKYSAIRQLQKEHDHDMERVKVDLEKCIENLKAQILYKDEQLVKDAGHVQFLQEQNISLSKEVGEAILKVAKISTTKEEIEKQNELLKVNCSKLENELSKLKSKVPGGDLDALNKGQVEALQDQVSQSEASKAELEDRLKVLDSTMTQDRYTLRELKTWVESLTTANAEQEKEIQSLKLERIYIEERYKELKGDFDELMSKNDSLSHALRDNEIDMQSQQEQLDHLKSIELELESSKKSNSSLSEDKFRLKAELNETNQDLSLTKSNIEELNLKLHHLNNQIVKAEATSAALVKDKENLIALNEAADRQRRELNEQLVVAILSAIKNLESPNTSPGSDKSYGSLNLDSSSESVTKTLPNPLALVKELSSSAIDRSNAYSTATQKLQAVLLENSVKGEELCRLKDELNNLNREKYNETQRSFEEAERLHTENQALIHDQQFLEARVKTLEGEVANLMDELSIREEYTTHANQVTGEQVDKTSVLNGSVAEKSNIVITGDSPTSVPDSTQFEYLKNIVRQFMLGKEPLILARVISAILKFDNNQIEQICRVQETVQSALKQSRG